MTSLPLIHVSYMPLMCRAMLVVRLHASHGHGIPSSPHSHPRTHTLPFLCRFLGCQSRPHTRTLTASQKQRRSSPGRPGSPLSPTCERCLLVFPLLQHMGDCKPSPRGNPFVATHACMVCPAAHGAADGLCAGGSRCLQPFGDHAAPR